MRFLFIDDPSVLSLVRMEFEEQIFGLQGDEMVKVEDKENMQQNQMNQLLNPPTAGKKPTVSLGRKTSKLTKTKSPDTPGRNKEEKVQRVEANEDKNNEGIL